MEVDLDALKTCHKCGCVYDKDYAEKNKEQILICPLCKSLE